MEHFTAEVLSAAIYSLLRDLPAALLSLYNSYIPQASSERTGVTFPDEGSINFVWQSRQKTVLPLCRNHLQSSRKSKGLPQVSLQLSADLVCPLLSLVWFGLQQLKASKSETVIFRTVSNSGSHPHPCWSTCSRSADRGSCDDWLKTNSLTPS